MWGRGGGGDEEGEAYNMKLLLTSRRDHRDVVRSGTNLYKCEWCRNKTAVANNSLASSRCRDVVPGSTSLLEIAFTLLKKSQSGFKRWRLSCWTKCASISNVCFHHRSYPLKNPFCRWSPCDAYFRVGLQKHVIPHLSLRVNNRYRLEMMTEMFGWISFYK